MEGLCMSSDDDISNGDIEEFLYDTENLQARAKEIWDKRKRSSVISIARNISVWSSILTGLLVVTIRIVANAFPKTWIEEGGIFGNYLAYPYICAGLLIIVVQEYLSLRSIVFETAMAKDLERRFNVTTKVIFTTLWMVVLAASYGVAAWFFLDATGLGTSYIVAGSLGVAIVAACFFVVAMLKDLGKGDGASDAPDLAENVEVAASILSAPVFAAFVGAPLGLGIPVLLNQTSLFGFTERGQLFSELDFWWFALATVVVLALAGVINAWRTYLWRRNGGKIWDKPFFFGSLLAFSGIAAALQLIGFAVLVMSQ